MTDPMIEVKGLGKRYFRPAPGQPAYKALRDLLAGQGTPRGEPFWALRHADFAVAPGEVLGIIGRNGAGKSTLLKLLSRITAPTEGEIRFRGRVGSLLAVGTGFHPELTGRENGY